ncbi:phosphate ABC transporter permease [Porphyromonas gulae]|uniref:phosphate ABC transporter permease subunit PstC n=1 Tax=Porphyromonas gulae TaxID=111105 RepID=UPI00052BD219|nr:phosphate ABC transporter permease subunit PstC [Porphyromonas gulae]KGO02121.1 phosphate ABC transporter permease [Porphyromonas gulae]
MKFLQKILGRMVEALFTLSGAITSIAIVLITLFLFNEGLGLFRSNVIEEGYALYRHADNRVQKLSPHDIKRIFDGEITNWSQLGGDDQDIMLFRIDDLFSIYSEEELGENYALLPDKIGEVIAANPGIIAFLPQKYAPADSGVVRAMDTGDISLSDFFGRTEWMPTASPAPLYGILPLILGTLLVSLGAIALALPLGLGVAIYLSELASGRIRKILKPAIELLAGIPSVVYGFWGLVVLVPWVQQTFGLSVGETAFTGSLILAIMALPTIITVAQDAMNNTPRSMREASLALGATRWQTVYKVVIPYAKSGISAAVVLGIGRAIGETMAVLMVTGNAAVMPTSFFESVRTIPATIVAELGEVPAGSSHYQALFLLGCILFVITMIISITAEVISKKQPKASV